MVPVLAAYRAHVGDTEVPTIEEFDTNYAHLINCDPNEDIAVIETGDGTVIAYCRTSWADMESGARDCIVFSPIHPDHHDRPLFAQLTEAQEAHARPWVQDAHDARYRTSAIHPGPGREPTEDAAWLESMGYTATEWGAVLVRPDLDDIPERGLPPGVEVRPVDPDQVRRIWEVHWEAFRGEWDFREATVEDIDREIAGPHNDTALWKIAWAGDQIVGQVKSFINPDENAERGYLRGYTEFISVHKDWRNKGIAGALLAMSLGELKAVGMTEAALGVDTNNPGGAFHLYTSLGFELQSYEAVYTKPIG